MVDFDFFIHALDLLHRAREHVIRSRKQVGLISVFCPLNIKTRVTSDPPSQPMKLDFIVEGFNFLRALVAY